MTHELHINKILTDFYGMFAPDESLLISVRSLTGDSLESELRWAKTNSPNLPETENLIPIHGTVGGDAVLQKKPQYVPEIDKDHRFDPRGPEYVAAGYCSMKAYPLFSPRSDVLGVLQIYFSVRHYLPSKKEEKAIQKLCQLITLLIVYEQYEKKNLEAALHQMAQEHAHSIHHHFKNKVVPLGGFATRIKKIVQKAATESRSLTTEEMGQISSYAEITTQSCAHLERVLADILNSGTSPLNLERVSFLEFLGPIIGLSAGSHDMSINCCGEFDAFVNIDKRRMEIMVHEILNNAAKAAKRSGVEMPRVEYKLFHYQKKGRDSICFEVLNDGEISEEIRDKIFDPFFTTDKEHGTGFGLSMAKLSAEQHGGAIRIKSHDGKTIVRIFIPIAKG